MCMVSFQFTYSREEVQMAYSIFHKQKFAALEPSLGLCLGQVLEWQFIFIRQASNSETRQK